ncbi:MAG TPA: hypothetical protein VMX94_03630 [Armatimonadota bacterium]|nr:hypothetical protein [Armatimonadota bacterium]
MIARTIFFTPLWAMLAVLISSSSAAHGDARSAIGQATNGFRDVTLTCKVLYANHAELKKIGKDFNKSYEFKSTTVRYKAPNKMKMEGKLGLLKAVVVINGDRKATIIPAIHYSKKENIRDEPHKRQTDIDIGIVTDSVWRDYIVLGNADERGPSGAVYKITFVRENARDKKHVCWVDARTLKLLKVEKHESDGSLKSRYIYSRHSLIEGFIWVPGRIDVYNQDGKLAGTTAYENIRINTGIPDSVFRI